MTNYELLIGEARDKELLVREKPLRGSDGRIKGKRIAIRKDLENTVEKACVLAEELGHYHTTTGCILNQQDISNRKQERRARIWAYDRLISLSGIVKAYKMRWRITWK